MRHLKASLFLALALLMAVGLDSARALQDGTAFSQVYVRRNFDYGMFVIEGWGNYDDQPVVTGFFMQSQQPGSAFYPELASLWRWTEIDWEFVPQTNSSGREQIESLGTFPNAAPTIYKSKAYNDNTKVAGQWTDDLIATAIGQNGGHNDVTTWASLVANTKSGGYWSYGDGGSPTWGFPPSLAQPARADLEKSVALNLFRMPPGMKAVTAKGVTSTFVPSVSTAVSGANITNQSFAWAKDAGGSYTYDPMQRHIYTVVWSPTEVDFYIDAPNGGTDIDGLTPVRSMKTTDFPSLVGSALDAPGGTLTWNCNGLDKKLNNLLMILNIYPQNGWGGTWPDPSFTQARTYVRRVAYYPFTNPQSIPPGPYTETNFITNTSDSRVFYVDPSTWTAANAKYNLQKNFYIDLNGIYGTGTPTFNHCPELTQWVTGSDSPDGQGAIELQMTMFDTAATPQHYYYFTMVRGVDRNATPINVQVTVDDPTAGAYATCTTYNFTNLACFWAPTGSVLTVHAKNLNTGQTNSCQIKLTQVAPSNLSWEIVDGSWADDSENMQFLSQADADASSQVANAGNIPVHSFGNAALSPAANWLLLLLEN